MENLKINWTRINNDVNGNPRYVCHFLNLVNDNDFKDLYGATKDENTEFKSRMNKTEYGYKLAIKRANKIGGRKFHTKSYGGGIVFQSYNLHDTEKSIFELLND